MNYEESCSCRASIKVNGTLGTPLVAHVKAWRESHTCSVKAEQRKLAEKAANNNGDWKSKHIGQPCTVCGVIFTEADYTNLTTRNG